MHDDKISKALVTARLRTAKRESVPDADEIQALQHVLALYEAESVAKKAAKEAQALLDAATLKRYGSLLDDVDIETLVLDDKWAASIRDRVVGEVNALTLDLVARIQQLGDRYDETVADLGAELEKLEARVAGHLASMRVES